MPDYTPPSKSSIPFKFTSGGYSPPDFNSTNFRFSTGHSSASLQAAINVMGYYQTATYTYLKYCPTYVIGYTTYGVQILKGPCVYGGIRDIGNILKGIGERYSDLSNILKGVGSGYRDLAGGIRAGGEGTVNLPVYLKQTYGDSKDLGKAIKGVISTYSDLGSYLNQVYSTSKDLPAWIKQVVSDTKDLPAYLKQTYGDYSDLYNYLKGWVREAYRDLPNFMKGVAPSDDDLPVNIYAMQYRDLPEYLNPVPGVDLSVYIQHNDKIVNLFANIHSIRFTDLPGIIRAKYITDIGMIISPVPSVNLTASIRALIYTDLGAEITGWVGPIYDLSASLTAVPFQALTVTINGFGGLETPVDLGVRMHGFAYSDLMSLIGTIEPVDLSATLICSGQSSNLGMAIAPKVVYFRKVLDVALLEHIDLKGMINVACFFSETRDIFVELYGLAKADLKGFVWGWVSSPGDAGGDLGVTINADVIKVEDKYKVYHYPDSNDNKYARLKLNFSSESSVSEVIAMDNCILRYGAPYMRNLPVYVTGVFPVIDLPVSITAVYDYNYNELPSWITPKTHEVVIDLRRGNEQIKKFIELMFDNEGTTAFHYHYVSSENKVYKTERDRHWTIWATSYFEEEDSFIERSSVRKKYVFNMSDFSNIDEAIRYLIDRVSSYVEGDLGASITGIPAPYLDLSVIIGASYTLSSLKNLRARIHGFTYRSLIAAVKAGDTSHKDIIKYVNCFHPSYYDVRNTLNGWMREVYSNLKCTVQWHSSDINIISYVNSNVNGFPSDLPCFIEGVQYVAPGGDELEFNFIDEAYAAPTGSGIEFHFEGMIEEIPEYVAPDPEEYIRVSKSNIEILRKYI